MQQPFGPVLVKLKTTSLREWGDLTVQAIVILLGIGILFLVSVDATVNNWAVNDFIGNGHMFVAPLGRVDNARQLEHEYSFALNHSISDLSRVANWMLNFTVTSIVSRSPEMYLLSVGTYTLTSGAVDVCGLMKGVYPLDLSVTRTARLGFASNSIMFIRGDALSHVFTTDRTENLANTSMKSPALTSLGYAPARTNVDVRLMEDFVMANTSAAQTHTVRFYRVFPKSFCTGCHTVAELGFGSCNMTFVYNDTAKVVIVTKSTNIIGSIYKVGLNLPQSMFSSASHYVKSMAIVFAVSGYFASRRTVQWKEYDATKVDSILATLVRILSPKVFPYPSLALRFDMFCYNSDIFVFLFAMGVILDMENSLYYLKTMNMYNAPAPVLRYSIQLYGFTTRLLWFNCALLKLLKISWNVIGTASYNGESAVMALFNLRNVTSLYLSAILLFFVPAFIDYNSSVTMTLDNANECLDTIHVDAFDSYYIRAVPAIAVGLVVNVLCIAGLDHCLHIKYWQRMCKNSLARQAIFNSSSIVCDYLDGIEMEGTAAVLHCKARRLSTLQWFFMSHMVSFGLPEKELRAKKKYLVGSAATNNRTHTTVQSTALPTESSSSIGRYLVVQDGDHHMHLVDENLSDVTALVYNIKVLKDLPITIE
ncbi:hypothetical protein SDRG_09723 [Saprolegnia diclina VS20]|uniref:Uncharacterized protein n=1 Tax=Saprolegnia diclina (strain VS20) TaxID=1156394 RepID=T0QDC9_SAPDV|nr:hypothetical protein SDRG_09723 [Saprolegnia diclina VS20]EQC32751.1 hypothetical protein SDRG_09723 [Saprolegnia diclina VS20]|eukprot:XP_008613895.1 hypothetical protein SDRG_09723 [Saprolegnia diclina VS20]